ncbi:type IV pilus secretin PilQ [Thioalkalicoccus limnaeus]|uniref:Type IV pilus secretin PilQ n=1 Tax=Thioalkalicoccus limnaeus TaxID=120681 RepID=A0ABV4BAS2_9GAMM
MLAVVGSAQAAPVLQDVAFSALPGNRVQIDLTLSATTSPPEHFATESPARIALDFPGVSNGLAVRTIPIQLGAVHSLSAVEASGRTRVVVNLDESMPYQVTTRGNQVTLALNTLEAPPAPRTTPDRAPAPTAARRTTREASPPLREIDFRRGPAGEGRVLIRLPSAGTRVAMREEASRVIVDIADTALPQRLLRRLDVTDFATPVVAVESRPRGRHVEVNIEATADYDYMAYQTDDLLTLEFRALTPAEKEELQRRQIVYSGDRLSLNFQDIEVRAVLQLLADFTGFNMVASDTVSGNITLRLKNVPWDQALDIILRTKGLSKREVGNVIMIAPTPEVAALEELELRSQQTIEELAPLRSEFIQVNYAKAPEFAGLIKSAENQLLSERGNVSFDARTNTLIVRDTARNLEEIRNLIQRLDVPVRQVMIESRVVIANDDFARDLGVRFGFTSSARSGDTEMLMGGGRPGHLPGTAFIDKGPVFQDARTGQPFNTAIELPTGSGAEALLVNLPVTDPSGAVNFLIGRVGSYLLQLELSAMQREGRGEIISNPRIITSDQKQAEIQVGREIPVVTPGSANNPATVEYRDATLKLLVTPHITPDDRIIMDLEINKDEPDFTFSVQGNPLINKRSVDTSVLVDNGETVVLGGVFEQTRAFQREQVPWLGGVPVLGHLFRRTERVDNNSELLIFVTPRILKSELAQGTTGRF